MENTFVLINGILFGLSLLFFVNLIFVLRFYGNQVNNQLKELTRLVNDTCKANAQIQEQNTIIQK